jgi:hypothetical protein
MLLGPIYGNFGGHHAMATPGLYLNEAEDISIPANQIDFALPPLASPVACNDRVALTPQKVAG